MAFYMDGKHNENMEYIEEDKFAVDVPSSISDVYGNYHEWVNIDSFKTREEAIKFAQEHFGADENGMVCLISTL